MPVDSFIIKGYQGDERDLEDRLTTFLNSSPPKKVLHVTSWTIGIEVYIMVLYQIGKPMESIKPKAFSTDSGTSYTGKIGDY